MNIRNTISMQDRMTPVFRSITRAMQSTLTSMERLDKASNKGKTSVAFQHAQRDIQKANNEIIKLQNSLDGADKKAQNVAKSASKIKSSFSGMNRAGSGGGSGFNLMELASSLYIIRQMADALKDVTTAADTARSTVARIGIFNTGSGTPDELYGDVYKTALATRSDLVATGNLATRVMMSNVYEGPTAGQDSVALVGIINKALVAGGSTTEENTRALLQLSQGLASGTLQGDELRSIREQTPYLTKIIAEGLGKAYPQESKFQNLSMGDLKQLGADGELTAARIANAMAAMSDDINSAFNKMPRTFAQAMTQVNTVWQYFLYLLSQGDGALAKINKAAWEFADWLASEDGWNTLQDLATIFGVIADAVIGAFRLIGDAFEFLQQHSEIAKAMFFAIAGAAAMAAGSAIAAWVAACWPVLLFATLLGIVVYMLYQTGSTTSSILGVIVGSVYALATVVWDIFWIVAEVIWFVIALVINFVLVFESALKSVGGMVLYAIEFVVNAATENFVAMATFVLGLLVKIAGAIDAIFGSSLSAGVNKWADGIADKLVKAAETTKGVMDQQGADIGSYWTDQQWQDYNGLANWRYDKNLTIESPVGAYQYGAGLGSNYGASVDNYDLTGKLGNISDQLSNISGAGTTTVDGGNLDSVGKIGSDVKLSEEDIKLLKDIAAKDYLISLAALTPNMQVSFGDVRETADVNAIMEAIEQMAEEALATSLV